MRLKKIENKNRAEFFIPTDSRVGSHTKPRPIAAPSSLHKESNGNRLRCRVALHHLRFNSYPTPGSFIENHKPEMQPPPGLDSAERSKTADRPAIDGDEDDDLGFSSASNAYSIDNFPSPAYIALYCFALHSLPRIAVTAYSAATDPTYLRRNARALRNRAAVGGVCLGVLGLGCWHLESIWERWGLETKGGGPTSEARPPPPEPRDHELPSGDGDGGSRVAANTRTDRYFGRTQKSIVASLRDDDRTGGPQNT